MKNNDFYRKTLVFTIIIILILSPLLPGINGEQNKITKTQTIKTETTPITFYTFDKTGTKQQNKELSKNISDEIINKLEILKFQTINNPLKEETLFLKQDFVETLNTNGLLPDGMTKDDVLKLLNPSWLNFFNKNTNNNIKETLIKIIKSRAINPFIRTFNTASSSDFNILCNMGSAGVGIPIPLFMLPRPRGLALWFSSPGTTYTSSLLTSKNFLAYGSQKGLAMGFVGVGLTGSFYGTTGYIFIGYATYTMMQAETFEYFTPPNNKPEITNENPINGAIDVPLSLSELVFRISDADGERMSYTVTTSPNIGSGSGSLKKDGIYKIPVSGLENNMGYSWTVKVSDGTDTTIKEFSFYTKMSPFNPFDEGWKYCKKITINKNMVEGSLSEFPVLISSVDADLKLKAQSDGDDILFMDNIGVAYRLYHEIDNYDNSNGKLVAWVKVPELLDSVDTVFFMYYGNPNCDNQQYPEKLWATQFNAVWHLNNDPSGYIFDSTLNNNHMSSHGSMSISNLVDGMIGKCLKFDGSNDYLNAPYSITLSPVDITVSGWYKPYDYASGGYFISLGSIDHWSNSDGHSYGFRVWENKSLQATFERDDSLQTDVAGNFVTSTNQWYYVALTYDETTNIGKLYINGELKGTVDSCHPTVLWYNGPWDFIIGASKQLVGSEHTPNYFQNCEIDEVHVLNIAKTSSWFATEYNNQNDPINFLSFGPEENAP